MQDCQPHQPYRKLTRYISRIKGPSTLATLFSHMWPRLGGGDIYSRRKPLFSSFGEHTAVCGSSVRQAVVRPHHRQSICIHNIHVAATCRPSVLGSATKTRPPVAKQSGQCARALKVWKWYFQMVRKWSGNGLLKMVRKWSGNGLLKMVRKWSGNGSLKMVLKMAHLKWFWKWLIENRKRVNSMCVRPIIIILHDCQYEDANSSQYFEINEKKCIASPISCPSTYGGPLYKSEASVLHQHLE